MSDPGHGASQRFPIGAGGSGRRIPMAEYVGNMSLRTEAPCRMIAFMENAAQPREIAIVVYPGVQSLDVTGPLEVFAGAQQLIEETRRRDRGYRVRVLGRDGRP